MTEEIFREKVVRAKEYFRRRGFDIEQHLAEFETSTIKIILEELRTTGEEFAKLLEKHYGPCLKVCLEEIGDRVASVLARRIPSPDLTSESRNERLLHMSILPFYFLYRFGNDAPEY